MAAQTWSTLKTTLLAALVNAQPPFTAGTGAFDVLFPQATSYAEARIYRDIVFLNSRQVNTSLATVAGSRVVDLSSIVVGPSFAQGLVVPEGFALLNPIGTLVPFDMASLDVIDEIWPVVGNTFPPMLADWLPRFWAMRDDHTIIYCPTADNSYQVSLTGLFQPAPITAANPSTYLSTTYPELLEMACMVFLTGELQHNWSSQSDDPKAAISHEMQYQALMQSARSEEMRRRGLAPDAPKGR